MKMTDVWDAAPCSLVETEEFLGRSQPPLSGLGADCVYHQGEALSFSETSVSSYQTTRHKILETVIFSRKHI
jgi:hypothetical protein